MSPYVVYAVLGSVLVVWYVRRVAALRAAGGADALAAQQLQAEFGLEPSETALQIFGAQSYIGALRPGEGGPSLFDQVVNAVDMGNRRSALFHVAITSGDRVLVSCEPLEAGKRRRKTWAATFGSQTAWFEPLGQVRAMATFAEAFPNVSFPRHEAPPRGIGRGWTLVILTINAIQITVWIDLDAVPLLHQALAPRRAAPPERAPADAGWA